MTLTPREREVMHLVAKGYTNIQIGVTMRLSESTVKWHIQKVTTKLDARNRTHAAVLYVLYHLGNTVAADNSVGPALSSGTTP